MILQSVKSFQVAFVDRMDEVCAGLKPAHTSSILSYERRRHRESRLSKCIHTIDLRLILLECLPGCLAIGKHTANGGYDDTGKRDAAYNIPPLAVVKQVRNQAIEQGTDNTGCAGGGA